jgi:hypothetical protein
VAFLHAVETLAAKRGGAMGARPHPNLSGPAQRAVRSVDLRGRPRKQIALTPRDAGEEA